LNNEAGRGDDRRRLVEYVLYSKHELAAGERGEPEAVAEPVPDEQVVIRLSRDARRTLCSADRRPLPPACRPIWT
jgi:hypothetical protein